MPKSKTSFLCSACGADFPKWHGKCPSCGQWGTLSEFKVVNKRYNKSEPQKDLNSLNQIHLRLIQIMQPLVTSNIILEKNLLI